MRIIDGVDSLVDKFFGVAEEGYGCRYGTKRTYRLNGLEGKAGDVAELLNAVHQQICSNWRNRTYCKSPSKQNWRCRAFSHYDGERNGLEVKLEREIIKAMGDGGLGVGAWMNNVPTSSGLCGPNSDKARNIDLVHWPSKDEFTFIELKICANTPIFAAVEILLRGVINVFTRQHLDEMKYDTKQLPMLKVEQIHLQVLAPDAYYHTHSVNLRWLQEKIANGLRDYANEHKNVIAKMDFEFQTLPCTDFTRQSIRSAMNKRSPAYIKAAGTKGDCCHKLPPCK